MGCNGAKIDATELEIGSPSATSEDAMHVIIRNVGGADVATLCLPGTATIQTVKKQLSETYECASRDLSLVLGHRTVPDKECLCTLPQPLEFQLVRLCRLNTIVSSLGLQLVQAASPGNLEAVKRLLQTSACPNYEDGTTTPLCRAASLGAIDIVRCLCEFGANKDLRGSDGRDFVRATALFFAAAHGHVDMLNFFIAEGVDLNKHADNGVTPLCKAIEHGHLDVARCLCDAGAATNLAGKDGRTPLIIAASQGHLQLVRYLCEAGADVDKADDNRWTPLTYASMYSKYAVCQYLCEAGADRVKASAVGFTIQIG